MTYTLSIKLGDGGRVQRVLGNWDEDAGLAMSLVQTAVLWCEAHVEHRLDAVTGTVQEVDVVPITMGAVSFLYEVCYVFPDGGESAGIRI